MSWNSRLADARSPDLIVSVSNNWQAAEAIRFARENGLRVSARGGGHSYEASALRNGGMMLDLSGIDTVRIDPASRTAWVGAGVRGGDLIGELTKQGFGFPIGHCADVSLSGYLLSGGFGWNSGTWGPACASVTAVEVVFADGTIMQIDDENHAELLWAARGAGAGFPAIATHYRLALHDLPAAVCAWSGRFTAASAERISGWLDEATRASPRSSEIACLVGPDLETGEPALAIRAIAFGDDRGHAEHAINAFRTPPTGAESIGQAAIEHLQFGELPQYSAMPSGKRVAADHLWSDASIGEMLVSIAHLAGVPCKSSSVNLFAFGGEASILPAAVPAALRAGGGNEAGIYAMWDDPTEDGLHQRWVRDVDRALAPHKAGRYVGEADLSAGAGRVGECFRPEDLSRLEGLRRIYDPEGLFYSYP